MCFGGECGREGAIFVSGYSLSPKHRQAEAEAVYLGPNRNSLQYPKGVGHYWSFLKPKQAWNP